MNGFSLSATLSALSSAWPGAPAAVCPANSFAFHGGLLALNSAVFAYRLTLVAADSPANSKELIHM